MITIIVHCIFEDISLCLNQQPDTFYVSLTKQIDSYLFIYFHNSPCGKTRVKNHYRHHGTIELSTWPITGSQQWTMSFDLPKLSKDPPAYYHTNWRLHKCHCLSQDRWILVKFNIVTWAIWGLIFTGYPLWPIYPIITFPTALLNFFFCNWYQTSL